jgi:ADP-ribosylglycohydrolase
MGVMRCIVFALAAFCLAAASAPLAAQHPPIVEFNAADLEDKIRGGMLGQVIGNLNGLPHEFKYIDEPGSVETYTPALPDGAWTDDDTDIEWVYLRAIRRGPECFLPPDRIVTLWKRHINRRIWCANRYARDLMDLGIELPWTGNVGLNPWSEFNISGQFVCESFGLMAPAMPQTAARLGLHYTHVTIDGEPAQATQLFTTMIAMAFVESDINKLLDAGLAAVDPQSEIAQIVREVRQLHPAHPDDWRKTRRKIRDRWQTHNGTIRDTNGHELNTAATIAALLYGQQNLTPSPQSPAPNPFTESLRLAFNFGWDCDNNAATAATILGVIKGRRWMNAQGWDIRDVYRNTSRDEMPNDETMTSFEDTLIAAARLAIENHGGELITTNGERIYRIRTEPPANVEPLATSADQIACLRETFSPRLTKDLTNPGADRARAAYIALCLGEAEKFRRDRPESWTVAVAELANKKSVVQNLFDAPGPIADQLRTNAKQAGLRRPTRD